MISAHRLQSACDGVYVWILLQITLYSLNWSNAYFPLIWLLDANPRPRNRIQTRTIHARIHKLTDTHMVRNCKVKLKVETERNGGKGRPQTHAHTHTHTRTHTHTHTHWHARIQTWPFDLVKLKLKEQKEKKSILIRPIWGDSLKTRNNNQPGRLSGHSLERERERERDEMELK
jgi:hypothetical protein